MVSDRQSPGWTWRGIIMGHLDRRIDLVTRSMQETPNPPKREANEGCKAEAPLRAELSPMKLSCLTWQWVCSV